ncbi:hypothetical protein PISMIDRAFT_417945 [Pisolithus microcarpus 441]|uniref:Uncharacterized protein n=1 Tax=Pisolithus microcarpus 441 TaxID=765257 RepID=A0A0C9YYW1_9AGAM|nr:hypothetical protein BKA83DRAFT_417945 [Pisolithus microcarpus]KIK13038.1 hypothetical protein PISMIDRAFT_417945 [Pisolithus microcarpus 441]
MKVSFEVLIVRKSPTGAITLESWIGCTMTHTLSVCTGCYARAYIDDSGLLTFGALSPLGSRIRFVRGWGTNADETPPLYDGTSFCQVLAGQVSCGCTPWAVRLSRDVFPISYFSHPSQSSNAIAGRPFLISSFGWHSEILIAG